MPGLRDPALALRVAHNLLLGHGTAVSGLRAILPRTAEVSLALNLHQVRAASDRPDDLDAARRIPPGHVVHEEEDGQTIDYHARFLFLQTINHGIEHRTNVTTILSGLGLPAPEVDGWAYMFAYPERFDMVEGSTG